MLDFLLGRRVRVKMTARDNFGRRTPGRYTTVTGECQFIGPNEHMGHALQITVDRMPIEVKSMKDVELLDE